MGPRGKLYCSRSCSNRTREHTAEGREKIGACQRGVTGPASRKWQGDAVGYGGVHRRASAALPTVCAEADGTCRGRLEVALKENPVGPALVDGSGRTYSVHPDDYRRLCCSHHRRLDYQVRDRAAVTAR